MYKAKNRFLSQNFPFGSHKLVRNTKLCGLGSIDFCGFSALLGLLAFVAVNCKTHDERKENERRGFHEEDTESTTSEPNVCG